MKSLGNRFLGWSLLIAISLPPTAAAHSILLDGMSTEWSARLPNAANLGIVVRDASGQGELWVNEDGLPVRQVLDLSAQIAQGWRRRTPPASPIAI